MITDYISLESLALQLALPKAYLKLLVDADKLPFLDTGNGCKRFQEQAVRAALSDIEQETLHHYAERCSHTSLDNAPEPA